MANQTNTVKDHILRLQEVSRLTGLARSTVYRDMANGTFPKNFKIGGSSSVGWWANDIQNWLDKNTVSSDEGHQQ